jgi:F-type H+-transporting ATPase subunit a
MIEISPDSVVLWSAGSIHINETIVTTWIVIALMVILAWLTTRNLSIINPISRRQNLLETIISYMRSQIGEISQTNPDRYLPFSGTLFLFISIANLLDIVPVYRTPTSSLSTTAALAICVFFAVPTYGIAELGIGEYLKHYIKPTILMLPFNVIGELSRTLALAIRLFGNMMSETLLVAILILIVPLFLPIPLQLLGLLIGQVQAYIFAVLATVYIVSASSIHEETVKISEGGV